MFLFPVVGVTSNMEGDTNDTSNANDSKESFASGSRLGKRLCESDSRLGKGLCAIEDEFGNYDVFISHRGLDTKTGFVGYLYEALKRAGLHPFLDFVSICKGQDSWKCIDHAIRTTPLALVIFSKSFAQSEWCLKELHAMLDSSSMKVLPIFYNVQPWEVSFPEKGQLAGGFAKLSERHDTSVMEEWRADLQRASKFIGWEYKSGDKRLEKDLVLEVVGNIVELANKPLPLHVGDHIVGVKQVARDLIKTIDEKKVLVLGLWGIGGIGKSTLARELYNQLGQRFKARCYVEDVLEKVNQGGVMIVQNHILKDLCENEPMQNIVDESSGKVVLEERLSKKSILLVLDDVCDYDQMENLLSRKMLEEGSICIVTSRNRHIFEKLMSSQVKHDVHIHDVQLLSQEDSRSLFACLAFGSDWKVPPRFEDLVGDVSMACCGVPLVLKVVGSLLREEEDVEIWKEVLKKLNCGSIMDEKKIFECPRISYDSLQEQHQEMFLDIVCALLEATAEMAKLVWGSEGWYVVFCVRSLVEKAMIRVEAKGTFDMLNHLQDIDLAIARQESKSVDIHEQPWGLESFALSNKNELEMKFVEVSSSLPSTEVQDDFEASSSIVSIEDDDCHSKEFMSSHHITKWIIYGDQRERTVLCFFNVEEMHYEFYFEDHKSMATIIGLGVLHSKVVLECESSHVTVVETLEEDWNAMWACSDDIPYSIPRGSILKYEIFPNILHRIASIINPNNIISKANNDNHGQENGKGKAQDNVDDRKGKGKAQDYDDHGNISHPNGDSDRASDDNDKEKKGEDGNNGYDQGDEDDGKTSNDLKEVKVEVYLCLLPGGVLEDKGKKKEPRQICEKEEKIKEGKICQEDKDGKMKEGEIHREDEDEKMKEREIHQEDKDEKMKEGEDCKGMEKGKGVGKFKINLKALLNALKLGINGNVVGNQKERTSIEGVEDGNFDGNLKKQLEDQIHSQMKFTFRIKVEAGGQMKSIQATICPITFQLPSQNRENYLQSKQFGWFNEYLQVAFGVVDAQVAKLAAESCKVLDPSQAKEVNIQGNAKGSARTITNASKLRIGFKQGVTASGEYNRSNGFEDKTTKEVQNSLETNKTLTKGGFSIYEETDLTSNQLKYFYSPDFPFIEKEFEVKDKVKRLKMYKSPICQLQRVSCEGTWYPYDSMNLEAYKLEASRELRMTRVYNLDLDTGEEKQQKGVWKVGKNLPLCFIQKFKKVVYLNHAMSHLTSSANGEYRLQEKQDGSNPSTFLTQGQYNKKPKWPSNICLVDVKQKITFECS